jgi:hypothetical protein
MSKVKVNGMGQQHLDIGRWRHHSLTFVHDKVTIADSRRYTKEASILEQK